MRFILETCSLRCQEWGKWVEYTGKLLAQGSKSEMELQTLQLDNPSNSEDDEHDQAGNDAKGQTGSCNYCNGLCRHFFQVSRKKGNTTRTDDSESEGNVQPLRKKQPRKKRKTRDSTENADCAGNEPP